MKKLFLIYGMLFSFSLYCAEQSVTFSNLRERIKNLDQYTFFLQCASATRWKIASSDAAYSAEEVLRAKVYYLYYTYQAELLLTFLNRVNSIEVEKRFDMLPIINQELIHIEGKIQKFESKK